MKRIVLFSLCILIFGGLSAQKSKLYHNDYSEGREGPMNFNPEWGPFYHGVASGDPLSDRVIIWTRVTPEEQSSDTIPVAWRVATDPELGDVVQSGTFNTHSGRDYTVKVDVTGLAPATTYYYGFTALDRNSLTGRTKTTPTADQADHLRFAIVSCNNFEAGYFNGFKRIADRNDLDAVIHLGDYIYEQQARSYGDSALWDEERAIAPENEILSLEDYRTRYSTYRLDSMLARAHQQHPFITVWDDHESANDSWTGGAQAHDPETEGDWNERLATAKQVYFEWMPIRDTEDRGVYRKISYGNIADLILLDTRIEGREQQINDVTDPGLYDPDRTILGAEQKAWFKEQLDNSTAQWKIVGQQVLFSEFNVGWAAAFQPPATVDEVESIFLDIWDGYPAERTEIIEHIRDNDIQDVVILTGDFHTTFSFEVVDTPAIATSPTPTTVTYQTNPGYDPETGQGAVAVEFAVPSVTSANFDENLDATSAALFQSFINTSALGANPNPHMKYVNMTDHGYYVLDVTPQRVQADYFFTPIGEVSETETTEAEGGFLFTNTGENHLQVAQAAAPGKEVQDIPAPADPPRATGTNTIERVGSAAILGIYPNPFSDTTTLHYSLSERARVKVDLLNAQGQLVRVLLEETLPPGVYTLQTQAGELPAGTYYYRMAVGNKINEVRIVLKR